LTHYAKGTLLLFKKALTELHIQISGSFHMVRQSFSSFLRSTCSLSVVKFIFRLRGWSPYLQARWHVLLYSFYSLFGVLHLIFKLQDYHFLW